MKQDRIWRVSLKVPMIHDMELAVSKTARTLAGYMPFSADQIDEITQALIEACINAIEHSKSEDRYIYIEFHVYQDRLEIQVSDRGRGFDKKSIQHPDIKRKIFKHERKRGWGLMLIRHYVDHLEIQTGDSGTRILMTKHIGDFGRRVG